MDTKINVTMTVLIVYHLMRTLICVDIFEECHTESFGWLARTTDPMLAREALLHTIMIMIIIIININICMHCYMLYAANL